MTDCDKLLETYLDLLSDSFVIRNIKGACVIQTPFRYLDNEPIKLYVRSETNGFRLSDRGIIEGHWFRGGLNPQSATAADHIQSIVALYGLKWEDREFHRFASEEDLGFSIHQFMQAMIRLSDLDFITPAAPKALSFRDQVSGFLEDEEFEVDGPVTKQGRSAQHMIDLVANHSPQPAFIEALTAKDSSTAFRQAKDSALKYVDLREPESPFLGIMVLDDSLEVWKGYSLSVVEEYSDAYVLWSRRNALLNYLTQRA